MNSPPKVFVVDDQPTILKALSRLLYSAGFEVTTFESAQQFLEGENTDSPGCILLDLAMPGMNGMALQQCLTTKGCVLPIIFLTGNGGIESSVRAMKLGAVDFLTKPVDDNILINAVRSALERNHALRLEKAEHEEIRQRWSTLTPREAEVLYGVVEGKLNKQIAAELNIAEKTIKVHRARVMTKMKAGSVADLVRWVTTINKITFNTNR